MTEVATSAFPDVAVDNGLEKRWRGDHTDATADDLPPVVLAGQYWLQGRHRVTAARAEGVAAVNTG